MNTCTLFQSFTQKNVTAYKKTFAEIVEPVVFPFQIILDITLLLGKWREKTLGSPKESS